MSDAERVPHVRSLASVLRRSLAVTAVAYALTFGVEVGAFVTGSSAAATVLSVIWWVVSVPLWPTVGLFELAETIRPGREALWQVGYYTSKWPAVGLGALLVNGALAVTTHAATRVLRRRSPR